MDLNRKLVSKLQKNRFNNTIMEHSCVNEYVQFHFIYLFYATVLCILKLISTWPGLSTLGCQRGTMARTAWEAGLGGEWGCSHPRPGTRISRGLGLGSMTWGQGRLLEKA